MDEAVRHPRRPSPTIRKALKTNPYTPMQLRRAQNGGGNSSWSGMGEAWSYVSYVISGVIVWGGIGMGLDHLVATKPVFTIIGALLGNFTGIYAVYLKAFRQEEGGTRAA